MALMVWAGTSARLTPYIPPTARHEFGDEYGYDDDEDDHHEPGTGGGGYADGGYADDGHPLAGPRDPFALPPPKAGGGGIARNRAIPA